MCLVIRFFTFTFRSKGFVRNSTEVVEAYFNVLVSPKHLLGAGDMAEI
jgi:hypothetical protein